MTDGGLKFDGGKINLTLIPWNVVQTGKPGMILPLYWWWRRRVEWDQVNLHMRAAYAAFGRDLITDAAGSLNYGAKKYAPWNWEKGIASSRLYAAACRHYHAIDTGEATDRESGLDHHCHLAFYAIAIQAARPDDRPPA